MSEEVLIPKMKRLDKSQKKVNIPINNFILVILCTLLIVGATFINIDLKHFIIPSGFSFGKDFAREDFIYSFSIIPQIPALMFACSVLGKKLGITCALLYVFIGLFMFPVFALGGGLIYVSEYSFGYIAAFVLGALITGYFINKNYSILNMLWGAILGVLVIHLCGITYMSILAAVKGEGKIFIQSWIAAQSGLKVIYDMVLGFVGILVGKYIHLFLKFLSD